MGWCMGHWVDRWFSGSKGGSGHVTKYQINNNNNNNNIFYSTIVHVSFRLLVGNVYDANFTVATITEKESP